MPQMNTKQFDCMEIDGFEMQFLKFKFPELWISNFIELWNFGE